ncbi:MAG: hypothetical protein COB78_08955 [Hyphomicrobiales bacterium]|nr:MAG: hypothetical protein COB78_08955 [Hyphomicrobiales bacterium]
MTLLLVGGTFSHADELPHQHYNQGTHEIEHEVAHHDHLSEADQNDIQLNGMHCGADIHYLVGDLNIVFERVILDKFPSYGRRCSNASFWPDPPPPRLIS